MSNFLWFFAVAVGPVILGGALLFALTRQRKLSSREKLSQSETVRDLYDKDGRDRMR